MTAPRKIGFVGLGTMGLPMAQNLVAKGFEVTGYDISAKARAALEAEGGRSAADCAGAAAGAGLVITMLPDASHVRDALYRPGGILEGMAGEAIFINMSTVLPGETDAIASDLAARGVRMIDAPVGRSALEARRGALLILASGAPDDLAAAEEAFYAMGNKIVDCGAVGGGSRAKVVNNFMGISLNALTAEALTLAEASGITIALALEVMRGTIAGLGHMRVTYPNKVLRGDLAPGFPVELAHKDLNLALQLAARHHVPVHMGAAAAQTYSIVRSMGRDREDYSAVYPVIRELAGLPAEIPYASNEEEYDPFST